MPREKVRRHSNTSLRFFSIIPIAAMLSLGWLLLHYYRNSEPTEFSGSGFDESSDQKWFGKLPQLSSPNHSDDPALPYSVIEGGVQNVDEFRNAIAEDKMVESIVPTYPPSLLISHLPLSLGGISVGAPTLPYPVHPQSAGGSPGLPPTMGGGGSSLSPNNSTVPQTSGGSLSLQPPASGGNPPSNHFLGAPPLMAGGSPPPPPSANGGNPVSHHALTTPLGSPGGSGNTDSGSPNTPPSSIQLPLSSSDNGTQATQPEGGNSGIPLTPFSGQPSPPIPPILGEITPPPSILLEASPLTEGGNSTPPAPVPEPSTLLLLSSGLASYLIYRRKSKKVR